MSSSIVFMYHGLYRSDSDFSAIESAERPYAVSVSAFERHLDYLAREGIPVLDPSTLHTNSRKGRGVVLTFDDGHISNYSFAMPILAERGLRAAFFITTDFIGTRPDYCHWQQIRQMAEAGMLIGTHGQTHRFFDDMTVQEAELEFRNSKEMIEHEIGEEVCQVSFPGGRYRTDQIALGISLGYQLFYSSKLGAVPIGPVPVGGVLSRVAVRNGTSDRTFAAFARGDKGNLLYSRLIAEAKLGARHLMGNRLYHQLYELLSRGH